MSPQIYKSEKYVDYGDRGIDVLNIRFLDEDVTSLVAEVLDFRFFDTLAALELLDLSV